MQPPLLRFQDGTLVTANLPTSLQEEGLFRWDPRTKEWRALGQRYRSVIMHCHNRQLAIHDRARGYEKLELTLKAELTPRPHQAEALKAWDQAGRQGVVAMPTGAGKTIFAVMAIHLSQRPALVVVPTIDLVQQWHGVLEKFFGVEVGILGGGQKEVRPLTVSTYDSAILFIERIGNQFGVLVFDECHHLPAPQYQHIAKAAIAPFRLGLSATVERSDGKEEVIFSLVGDIVYEAHIHQMSSNVLAPYDVVSVQVPLTDEEHARYTQARNLYLGFVRRHGISFNHPQGWMQFVRKASQSEEGREALKAHREQKRLAQGSSGKIDEIWRILRQHADERVIIFTDDNNLAYRIGREFLLPVLTHHTKLKERKRFLEAFRTGELSVLVTSKVLNEGVDVPEASIGIVVSGSGGVREHVQRLGRILRHKPGKRATLYEIIAKDTSEFWVNKRRRQHYAYQKSSQI